jgi:hypothetical protein
MHEYRNWETEHYNYVLEITVSFLGIHKWQPHIYIEVSPTLHLQCMGNMTQNTRLFAYIIFEFRQTLTGFNHYTFSENVHSDVFQRGKA